MNIGSKIFGAILTLVAAACTKQAPSTPPMGPDSMVQSLRLESLYMHAGVTQMAYAPVHSVSLVLSGRIENTLMGTLMLDPNVCGVNGFGDRTWCTRMAVQGIDVELHRMRLTDPAGLERKYFEVAGEGLPKDVAMIVQGSLEQGKLERCYLVMGTELVPLYLGNEP